MSNPIDDKFIYEDADNMLLLIGRQDNGSVYISVQDREPVNLPPTVAVKVAHAILERSGSGYPIVVAEAVAEAARRLVARDRVAALVIRP